MILLQVLLSGLSLAGYYALLAVGFALIFATLKIFHVAHGAVFASAGYLVYLLHRVYGLDLLVSAVPAIAGAAVLGLLIDRIVYQPIARRGGGLFSVFIASLGVTLIIEAIFLLLSKGRLSVARQGNLDVLAVGDLSLRLYDVFIALTVAVLYALLYLWIMRTRTGAEIRALTDNASLASIVGVNVDRTRIVVFGLASALAGLAGVFTAYDAGVLPDTGTKFLFITFAAVIFGGTRNVLAGSLLGSLVMGVVTAFGSFFAPPWVTTAVFLMLIAMLVWRPSGLLGS